MRKTLGYMVTWTTYGTWLQGDERGWVKKGTVHRGNAELHKVNEGHMKGKAVRLGKREKEVEEEAICKKAEALGEKMLAISVWSNHVHIVLGYSGRPVEETVRIYKNTTSAALRRSGFEGKVWTRGFDKRFCFSEKDLKARVDYVNKHGMG